ncbi:MAG: MerR family transcriptional regulator [Alistipes sp.]|nr:MerR family transcriptional regulator [Alistipes sp.]
MSDKIYYTMGEVAEMFDVNASLIRYWGTQFPSLKPHRNKKGNRLFSPSDIETLKRIYHYVKECGMTLEGAKRALRGDRSEEAEGSADMELLERLQSLRSMLVAVRDSLDEQSEREQAAAAVPSEPVPAVVEQAEPEPEPQPKPAYREQTLFEW